MHSAGQSSICALRFYLQQSRPQFQQAPSSCLGSMVRGRVSQVDDMVNSNSILYSSGEHPDHVVVIKYVPYVADSKRAMDEYTSEIFMGGRNTIALHNTCEDSLLAAPIILDLAILTELLTRIEARSWQPLSASCPKSRLEHARQCIIYGAVATLLRSAAPARAVQCQDAAFSQSTCGASKASSHVQVKRDDQEDLHAMHPVAVLLSYLTKAPLVPDGTPVINALARQRAMLENVMRACIGLPPDNNMMLEFKV